ncbi:Protein of unknown function DUF566 [Cynara cardunculus var. scolymus]|uniref:QWRF family n=1 Tax=Cynara cardunculus var. scolymus TaxID=59895 RepID=A0A118JV85_CYNCS|nr:Protein of unknown function DUF566 [Cynara cardunculus var. scolymus]
MDNDLLLHMLLHCILSDLKQRPAYSIIFISNCCQDGSMWPNLNGLGVCETLETPRPPLRPAEKSNGTKCQSRTREVSSRYKSPAPRRYPSPNTRTVTTLSSPVSNRAVSAERRRSGTPQSPSRPSTSVHDTSLGMELAARKAIGSKLPESLWPSRMRSLSVAFQSVAFSLSTSKKEKPPPQALSDRTLNSSSNVLQKQLSASRSPPKGKHAIDRSENSKPLESVHARLLDQHRWPSRTGSKALNKSNNLPGKPMKTSIAPNRSVGASPLRRMLLPDYTSKPLEKYTSDPGRLLSSSADNRREEYHNLQRISNLVSSSLSEKTVTATSAARSQSLPATGAPPSLPNKPSGLASKSVSPSRTRIISLAPSRGASPSRIRSSSPLRSCNSNRVSVLTFAVDMKKGKRVADQIEDAHYLRLLHNRQMQWRFVNASAETALKSQKATSKKSLFNVWRSTSELRDSVAAKRTDLNQLRLKLKLHSVLNQQMAHLDEWTSIERENHFSLSGAIEDLQSSTLQLPVTGAATVDIETVKSSLCSAIQVMQTMGSSLHSTLSTLEGSNWLVSELATVAAQERALLDECEVKTLLLPEFARSDYVKYVLSPMSMMNRFVLRVFVIANCLYDGRKTLVLHLDHKF